MRGLLKWCHREAQVLTHRSLRYLSRLIITRSFSQSDMKGRCSVTAPRVFILVAVVTLVVRCASVVSSQQSLESWSDPVEIAYRLSGIDPPRMIADVEGTVHVFWSDESTSGSTIYYRSMASDVWSEPNDVIAMPALNRAMVMDLAIDERGEIHLIFLGGSSVYYAHANASSAAVPQAWSPPQLVYQRPSVTQTSASLLTLAGNEVVMIVVDFGGLKILTTHDNSSWSAPTEIWGSSEIDETIIAVRAMSDASNRIHVVWSTIVDGDSRPWPGNQILYAHSGQSNEGWSEPRVVDSTASSEYDSQYGPHYGNVATFGSEEIHLVWLGAPAGQRWHEYSLDGGTTWSVPVKLHPDLVGITQFPAIAIDAEGAVQVVTAGFGIEPGRVSFYHFEWRSGRWSGSLDVDPQHAHPFGAKLGERPQLAIALGNRLELLGHQDDRIWYRSNLTGAEPLTVRNLPAPQTVANFSEPSSGKSELEDTPGAQDDFDGETTRRIRTSDSSFVVSTGVPSAFGIIFGAALASMVVFAVVFMRSRHR